MGFFTRDCLRLRAAIRKRHLEKKASTVSHVAAGLGGAALTAGLYGRERKKLVRERDQARAGTRYWIEKAYQTPEEKAKDDTHHAALGVADRSKDEVLRLHKESAFRLEHTHRLDPESMTKLRGELDAVVTNATKQLSETMKTTLKAEVAHGPKPGSFKMGPKHFAGAAGLGALAGLGFAIGKSLVGEKTAFFRGFVKSAEKKKNRDPFGEATVSAIGGMTAPLAATPLALGGLAMDKKLSPEEAKTYAKRVNQTHGRKTKVNVGRAPIDLASHYHPAEDTANVARRPSRGVLAHELGHARSLGAMTARKQNWLMKGYQAGKLAPLAPAALMMSGNEHVQAAAPYAGLAMAAPQLAEEASASVRGLRDVKRLHGGRAALRSLPAMLGAYSTYLAAPAASGLIAHHYNKKNKAQKALPKTAASKEELRYVLKKHEERETPEQEKAESEKEQRIEREAGLEGHSKQASVTKTAFWDAFKRHRNIKN